MELVILACAGGAYLAATFVAAAMVVRFWPSTRLARRLRLDLAFFTLLPLLLFVAGTGAIMAVAGRTLDVSFEALSGRRRYRRRRYGLYGWGRAR